MVPGSPGETGPVLEGLEDGKGVGPSTEQALLTPSGSRWAKLALEEQLHQMSGERLGGWGPVWRPCAA